MLVEITHNYIAENARIAQDQGEYQKRYNGLVERYEKAKARFDDVTVGVDGGMTVVFRDGDTYLRNVTVHDFGFTSNSPIITI